MLADLSQNHPELEGICKDYWVQLPASQKTTQKSDPITESAVQMLLEPWQLWAVTTAAGGWCQGPTTVSVKVFNLNRGPLAWAGVHQSKPLGSKADEGQSLHCRCGLKHRLRDSPDPVKAFLGLFNSISYFVHKAVIHQNLNVWDLQGWISMSCRLETAGHIPWQCEQQLRLFSLRANWKIPKGKFFKICLVPCFKMKHLTTT